MPRRYTFTPQRTKPSVQPLSENDTAWSRLPPVLQFCGMGHTKFYELIGKKLMPKPTRICGGSYWRVREIREAIKKLKEDSLGIQACHSRTEQKSIDLR